MYKKKKKENGAGIMYTLYTYIKYTNVYIFWGNMNRLSWYVNHWRYIWSLWLILLIEMGVLVPSAKNSTLIYSKWNEK